MSDLSRLWKWAYTTLFFRTRSRAEWEAICIITQCETGGRLQEPSPSEVPSDAEWMVIAGIDALCRGDSAEVAMVNEAPSLYALGYRISTSQIRRRASVVEMVFHTHFPWLQRCA